MHLSRRFVTSPTKLLNDHRTNDYEKLKIGDGSSNLAQSLCEGMRRGDAGGRPGDQSTLPRRGRAPRRDALSRTRPAEQANATLLID